MELRGRVGTERRVVVLGAVERPAVATGAVAASTTLHVLATDPPPGAYGLGGLPDPLPLLCDVAGRGVHGMRFEGVTTFV